MVAPKEGKWMKYAVTAIVALALSLGLGCASESAPQAASETASQTASPGTDRLTDVRVETSTDATTITLLGLVDPIYTASLSGEPRALVLDLASVEIGTPDDLVMVYDGLVDHVTVSKQGAGSAAVTRVEIALAKDAVYEMLSSAAGVKAVLRPSRGDPHGIMNDVSVSSAAPNVGKSETAASSPLATPAQDDPWADPDAPEVGAEGSSPVAGEATAETGALPALASVPSVPATKLTGLDATQTEGGVLVHLAADGAVFAMETFTLANPDRLVIDLPGLASALKNEKLEIGSPLVARVRLGAHADKIRVVIDGGAAAQGFASRRVTPAANGLYLAIGAGPALDAALEAAVSSAAGAQTIASASGSIEGRPLDAAAEAVADAHAAGASTRTEVETAGVRESAGAANAVPLTRVYGVQYDSGESYERVVILCDGLVDYNLLKPDFETVIVSIPRAEVAPEATGRVPVGANRSISLISTFQQPDVETPEVRVVVRRATNLEPEVTRRGSMIFLDFPNKGLVAAPPPAFAPELDGPRPANEAGAGESVVAEQLAEGHPDGVIAETIVTTPEGVVTIPAAEDAPPAAGEPWADSDAAIPAAFAADPGPAALEAPAASEILEEGGLIDGKRYEGRRISLDFKDVPVADVLRLIAEVSDLNLIAGDEVEGNVTIRLVDVPWDQALDVILLTKGLGFVRVGNVLRIAPADIIKAEEELRLQERRNKETLEDLMVKLQPVNYAGVKEMAALVTRLLTPRGTVNVDLRTNTLILKDIASVIDEATALIKAIDTETPQVLIEAKIVEAALDFSRELGSTWAVGSNEFEDGFTESGVNDDLGGPDFRFYDQNNVAFGNPITSVPTALMNMNAFVLNEDFNVNVQIQAAESTGDGKVISSPRVLTLDNREASIQQGVSIPFQTFENGDAKLEFIDAVLSLLVTPHVTSDKTIIMQILVTRNAPDDSVPTPTGSPAIARAETKTETLVKDGQTLVIGGIYTVNESQRESRVPYLHRLPLLGSAFKSKEVTDQRKELLIFVTPRIIVASELAGG